jgi:hypothetical protein
MRRALGSLVSAVLFLVCGAGGAEPAPAGPPVPDGTQFHFLGMVYLSGRIEFRDATQELWPNYFYEGKYGDVRGKMVFHQRSPELNFSLVCNRLVQPNDGMEYKILGELIRPDKVPVVRFATTKVGAWLPAGADGQAKTAPHEALPIEGELEVDGRRLNVKGACRVRYNTPKGGDLRGLAANSLLGVSVNVTAEFNIKGKDLGLKKVADKDIQVRVQTRAYTEATILSGTKKKTLQEALEPRKTGR